MSEKDLINQAAIDISEYLKTYSIEDIAKSLFVTSLWLPNISSTIKHRLLATAFIVNNSDDYNEDNRIVTYEEFREFTVKLIEQIPSFPFIEDYVPERDWGEIQYYFSGKCYQIFYGCEISNIYDYLSLFELLHCSFDDEFKQYSNLSPKDDLLTSISLQHRVISEIKQQVTLPDSINPGHFEVPSKDFWLDAIEFLKQDITSCCDMNQLEEYSCSFGSLEAEAITEEGFLTSIYEDDLLPFYFIKHQNNYFPLLPRRYSHILFDNWAVKFKSMILDKKEFIGKYRRKVNQAIHTFIKNRIRVNDIFCNVSATHEQRPINFLFSAAMISGDELFMFYITDPFVNRDKTENELQKLVGPIKNSRELIKRPGHIMALHDDKEFVGIGEPEGTTLTPRVVIIIPQITTVVGSLSLPSDLNA